MEGIQTTGPGPGTTQAGAPVSLSGAPGVEALLGTAERLSAKHGGAARSSDEQRAKWRAQKVRQNQARTASDTGTPAAAPVGTASAPAPALPDPSYDPALIRTCFDSLITAINDAGTSFVYRKAMKVTDGDKPLSLELAQGVDVTVPRKKLITETFTVIAQKYSLLGRYFPEFALLSGLASWAGQFTLVLRKLAELENRMPPEPQKP